MELPEELFESAAIDGAGEAPILFRIVLPLSKAVSGGDRPVLRGGVLERVLQRPALHQQSSDKWPMALVLRTYVVNQTTHRRATSWSTPARSCRRSCRCRWRSWCIAIVPILMRLPVPAAPLRQGRDRRRRQGLTASPSITDDQEHNKDLDRDQSDQGGSNVSQRIRTRRRCSPAPAARPCCSARGAFSCLLQRTQGPRQDRHRGEQRSGGPADLQALHRREAGPARHQGGCRPGVPQTYPKERPSRWPRSRATARR